MQERSTALAKAFRDCTVQVLVPFPPWRMVRAAGLQDRLKSAAQPTAVGVAVAQALARPKQDVFDPTGRTM